MCRFLENVKTHSQINSDSKRYAKLNLETTRKWKENHLNTKTVKATFISKTIALKTKLWPKHTIFKGIKCSSKETGEGIKSGKIIQEMKTRKDNKHWWLIVNYEQNSRRQWRRGKPEVLQSMGPQRGRHNLETEHQHMYCWLECE